MTFSLYFYPLSLPSHGSLSHSLSCQFLSINEMLRCSESLEPGLLFLGISEPLFPHFEPFNSVLLIILHISLFLILPLHFPWCLLFLFICSFFVSLFTLFFYCLLFPSSFFCFRWTRLLFFRLFFHFSSIAVVSLRHYFNFSFPQPSFL